jgi:hypothetical protein
MISKLSTNKRLLFLLDGVGAMFSTIFLLYIAFNEPIFGMPKTVLFKLIPVTAIFSFYSISCYYLKPPIIKPYLLLIAIANLLYCAVTFVLLIVHFNQLSVLGVAYFISEKLIVIPLAIFEIKIALSESQ